MAIDEKKTFAYKDKWSDNLTVAFVRQTYAIGDNTAILAVAKDEDEPWWEEYASVTTNLPDCAHADGTVITNDNDAKHLVDWMIDNNLLVPTGRKFGHGFCTYREARPTKKFLDACLEPKNVYEN